MLRELVLSKVVFSPIAPVRKPLHSGLKGHYLADNLHAWTGQRVRFRVDFAADQGKWAELHEMVSAGFSWADDPVHYPASKQGTPQRHR